MDIVNDNRITAVSGVWGAENQDSISTMNDALAKAIEKAISYAKQHPLPPSKLIAGEVEKMVLGDMNAWINLTNSMAGRNTTKIARMNYLTNSVIARLMIELEGVKALNYANGNDSTKCQLGIYQYAGSDE